MKRILLVFAAAVLFLNTVAVPSAAAFADGGATTTNCDGKMCKP